MSEVIDMEGGGYLLFTLKPNNILKLFPKILREIKLFTGGEGEGGGGGQETWRKKLEKSGKFEKTVVKGGTM